MTKKKRTNKTHLIDTLMNPKLPKWFLELSPTKQRKVAAESIEAYLGNLSPDQEKKILKDAVKQVKARKK